MDKPRTFTVQFSDGPRELTPHQYRRQRGVPDEPQFDVPGYRIVSTCDGKHIAVRESE